MAQFAMAGVSAIMQFRAGQAQKQMYNAQAAQAQLQGRAKAIEAKQKALRVLQNLNETLATTVARSSTGGGVVNSLSLQNYAMSEGTREYYTAKDNSVLAIGQANHQAGIYKAAGKQAMLGAVASAAGTLGQGYYNQSQVGWPGSTKTG